MKTTIALLSVMALAGSLTFGQDAPAGAPPKGPRGQGKERPNPGEFFKKLDTSGDSQVDLAEFKAGPMGQRLGDKAEEAFNKLDGDKSKGISMDEFKAFRPERGGNRPPGDRPNPEEGFKKLDTSNDGQVDPTEFKNGPMGQRLGDKADGLFKKIDADTSGGISLKEFSDFRPERGGPGKRGGDRAPSDPAPVK